MSPEHLRHLLESVQSGEMDITSALSALRTMPFEDLGFAKLDHHRAIRTGFPEVIFCPGKTNDQITQIMQALQAGGEKVLATRATPENYQSVVQVIPAAVYYTPARIIVAPGLHDNGVNLDSTASESHPPPGMEGRFIGVISAGTADLPVAEEAAITAEQMGSIVRRFYDIGVAGLHRLLEYHAAISESTVLVVVAGMEGALASVVGGLVPCPVVAVPTSIGYGANFGGLAPLLSMLNTCATGVAVVNIDNGFGAGYYAHLINTVGTNYLSPNKVSCESST